MHVNVWTAPVFAGLLGDALSFFLALSVHQQLVLLFLAMILHLGVALMRCVHDQWVRVYYLLKLPIWADYVLRRHHWHLNWRQVLGDYCLLSLYLSSINPFQIFIVKNFRACTRHKKFLDI